MSHWPQGSSPGISSGRLAMLAHLVGLSKGMLVQEGSLRPVKGAAPMVQQGICVSHDTAYLLIGFICILVAALLACITIVICCCKRSSTATRVEAGGTSEDLQKPLVSGVDRRSPRTRVQYLITGDHKQEFYVTRAGFTLIQIVGPVDQ